MARNQSKVLNVKKNGEIVANEQEIVSHIMHLRKGMKSYGDCAESLVKTYGLPSGTAADRVRAYRDKYETFTEDAQSEFASSLFSTLKGIYGDLDRICTDFRDKEDLYAEATVLKIKLDVAKTFGKHFVPTTVNHTIAAEMDNDTMKNKMFEHYGKKYHNIPSKSVEDQED